MIVKSSKHESSYANKVIHIFLKYSVGRKTKHDKLQQVFFFTFNCAQEREEPS